MTIDLDSLLKFAIFLFSVGSTLYAYAAQRDKATHAQIRELEQKVVKLEGDLGRAPDVVEMERRVAKIEGDLAHVPDAQTLHRLELSMQKVQVEVETMKDKWDTGIAAIRRLEEFLLSAPPLAQPTRKRASK